MSQTLQLEIRSKGQRKGEPGPDGLKRTAANHTRAHQSARVPSRQRGQLGMCEDVCAHIVAGSGCLEAGWALGHPTFDLLT